MTDAAAERPRPQFGEYASREEQLAHIKTPSPEQLNPTPDTAGATAPAQPAPSAANTSATSPQALQNVQAARLQFNTVATIAFLVYGLIEVVSTTPSFLNFGVRINEELEAFAKSSGATIDTYAATPATQWAGYALIALWIALWLGAALLSWSRLRARKVSIWVPFLAGVIANLAVGVAIAMLVMSDPVITQQLINAVTGGA